MKSEASPHPYRLIWLLLLVTAIVLPFLGKPPHIDEESYLFIGKAIQGHLLRPYDWWRPWQPFSPPEQGAFVYAHPPLFLWLMSLLQQGPWAGRVGSLRLCMLPLAWLLTLGLYTLAQRLVKQAGALTAAFLLSPAIVLVLHQNLMIDLPFLTFSVLACACLLEAANRRSTRLEVLGGLFLSLACLIRYPALVLLLLAFVDDGRHRRSWRRPAWPFILSALLPVALWELWTVVAYGQPHLWYVLSRAGEIDRAPLLSRGLGTLAHLGFSAFGPPLLLLLLGLPAARHRVIPAFLLAAGLSLLLLAVPTTPPLAPQGLLEGFLDDLVGEVPTALEHRLLLGLSFFLGTLLLSVMRPLRGIDRFLQVWALLTLLTGLLAYNFAGARYLSPAIPPLLLLFWRTLERAPRGLRPTEAWGLLIQGGLLALYLGVADYRQAAIYRELAADVAVVADADRMPASRVWFRGEWGFRYELESRGFRYLPPGARPAPGDLLALPVQAGPGDEQSLSRARVVFEATYGVPGLRTLSDVEGISFYSDALGLLPYGYSHQPMEGLRIWKMP